MFECPQDYDQIYKQYMYYESSYFTFREKIDIYKKITDCYNRYIVVNEYEKKRPNESFTQNNLQNYNKKEFIDYVRKYLNLDIDFNKSLNIFFNKSLVNTKFPNIQNLDYEYKLKYLEIIFELMNAQIQNYSQLAKESQQQYVNSLINVQNFMADSNDQNYENIILEYNRNLNVINSKINNITQELKDKIKSSLEHLLYTQDALVSNLEQRIANDPYMIGPSTSKSILNNYTIQEIPPTSIPENMDDCVAMNKELQIKLQTCNTNNNEIIRESNLATQNFNMNQQLLEQQKEIEKLNLIINDNTTIINNWKSEYENIFQNYNNLNNRYNEIMLQQQNLPIFMNKVNEINATNATLQKKLNQLNSEKSTRNTELNKLKGIISQMEEDANNYHSEYQKILNLNAQSCDATGKENIILRTEILNKNKNISSLQNANENLQKQIKQINLQYVQLINNCKLLTEKSQLDEEQQQQFTHSLSKILLEIENEGKQFKETTNSNSKTNKIIHSKPYELKTYLYNTVAHRVFDVGEVNKSLLRLGTQNLKYALRNRRYEGQRYKNTIKILSDKSQEDLFDYKSKLMNIFESPIKN